jgi:hypothetical protein
MLRLVDRLFAKRSSGEDPASLPEVPSLPPLEIPGDPTVFDDVALRLRRLSVDELYDMSATDPGAQPGAFKIRLARTRHGEDVAGSLVQHRYVARGLDGPTVPSTDPHLSTFCAYDEGKLVGTVGIRLDSERGLAADDLYRDEIDFFRARGQKLCEFTRLAVDARSVSKPVLAGLFHTAYLYAAKLRGHDLAVIEVNPRHVAYYRKALGFKLIGPERLNRRVNAPAVLLAVPFRTVAEGLATYAGRPEVEGANRSLFVYGFSSGEEHGILRRLRETEPRR